MSTSALPPRPHSDVSAPKVGSEEAIPASLGQRRLWILEQMEPGAPIYNIPYLVRLEGGLSERALERALNTVIERHEALRTNFAAAGSEPMQHVRTSWML